MIAHGLGPQLDVHDYEGTEGNCDHITRNESGLMPTAALARLRGVKGERPGESPWHRRGQDWEDFKTRIGQEGMKEHVFITVDHGAEPKIFEGNQRRDAAVELGHPYVPVNIRYFGHAEQQGTVFERHIRDKERGE
jgi:hypothetical protein